LLSIIAKWCQRIALARVSSREFLEIVIGERKMS